MVRPPRSGRASAARRGMRTARRRQRELQVSSRASPAAALPSLVSAALDTTVRWLFGCVRDA
jgi:hypothetical protein